MLQIPVFIIAGFAVWFNVRYAVPSDPSSGTATPATKQSPWQLIKRIDWLGTFLLAGWVGAALVAVSLNTNSTSVDAYPWTSPTILGLFAASAVLFVIFLLVELKWASEPVMPFELLHSRTPVSVALNNLILSIVFFGCASRSIATSLTVKADLLDVLGASVLHGRASNVRYIRWRPPHPQRGLRHARVSSLRYHCPFHGEILLAQLLVLRRRCRLCLLPIAMGHRDALVDAVDGIRAVFILDGECDNVDHCGARCGRRARAYCRRDQL
jgi:hypothetical protein